MSRDPSFDDDGRLRPITRIEFEILDEDLGRYKWNVWSEDVLLEAHAGGPQELQRYLASTWLYLSPVPAPAQPWE